MNMKRFVGKNAREAMAQVRVAYGEQAVVLSNRPVPGGVEILAMPSADIPEPAPAPAASKAAVPEGMSTLSFQEFVRERQRQEELAARAAAADPAAAAPPRAPVEPGRFAAQALREERLAAAMAQAAPMATPTPLPVATTMPTPMPAPISTAAPMPLSAAARAPMPSPMPAAASDPGFADDVRSELKQMRALLTGQLASLAWFDSVRRSPAQTRLLRLMLGNGFSPALARHVLARLPADGSDEEADAWLLDALGRNLRCAGEAGIQKQGGVYAVVGPTGVGKTTTTAKIAARFALEHGAASVGLITVDTYRMAASDQLRAFGRLLNIPVHTARDSASLADMLQLFVGKKLVLVDTVGIGQRDRRVAELLAALPGGRLQRLVVLNAGAQGEVLEEVVQAYSAGPGTRCVISKLDEAARCGAAIDVALRQQLVVEGFANGQRVPEDWHAARAQLLVQKALLKPAASVFLPDDAELGLVLTAPAAATRARGLHA